MDNKKFCTQCGAILNKEAKFCTSCGAKVVKVSSEIHFFSKLREAIPAKKSSRFLYIIIIGIVLILILYAKNLRQENHNDTLFAAKITKTLIGKDGNPQLTGEECIDIAKFFQGEAASSLSMSREDIKSIMQTFKDEGGMYSIKSANEYKIVLKELLADLEELSSIFQTSDYVYLTKEIVSFMNMGFPFSSIRQTMTELYLSSSSSGLSYDESKKEIFKKQ